MPDAVLSHWHTIELNFERNHCSYRVFIFSLFTRRVLYDQAPRQRPHFKFSIDALGPAQNHGQNIPFFPTKTNNTNTSKRKQFREYPSLRLRPTMLAIRGRYVRTWLLLLAKRQVTLSTSCHHHVRGNKRYYKKKKKKRSIIQYEKHSELIEWIV